MQRNMSYRKPVPVYIPTPPPSPAPPTSEFPSESTEEKDPNGIPPVRRPQNFVIYYLHFYFIVVARQLAGSTQFQGFWTQCANPDS